jgi:hypothetical protein
MRKKQPVHEIRIGTIKVNIWCKKTRTGHKHTLNVVRLYRNGDVWIESSRFSRDDVPLLRKVLDAAHTWIYLNSR